MIDDDISQLRKIISLRGHSVGNGEIYISTNNKSLHEVLLALMEDVRDGFFHGYTPVFEVHYQDMDHCQEEPTSSETFTADVRQGWDTFMGDMERFYNLLKNGSISVNDFFLAEGLSARPDVVTQYGIGQYNFIAYFNKQSNPLLRITPRTETRHLEPFIDGKIEDGKIDISEKGEVVIKGDISMLL